MRHILHVTCQRIRFGLSIRHNTLTINTTYISFYTVPTPVTRSKRKKYIRIYDVVNYDKVLWHLKIRFGLWFVCVTAGFDSRDDSLWILAWTTSRNLHSALLSPSAFLVISWYVVKYLVVTHKHYSKKDLIVTVIITQAIKTAINVFFFNSRSWAYPVSWGLANYKD